MKSIIKIIILFSLLLAIGLASYRYFPVFLISQKGNAQNIEIILQKCPNDKFKNEIPIHAGQSYYILEREFSAWRLTVFGKVKSCVDRKKLYEHWQIFNEDVNDVNIRKLPNQIQQKYNSIEKKSKNKISYTATLHGSKVFLTIFPDENYYHLLIWHR